MTKVLEIFSLSSLLSLDVPCAREAFTIALCGLPGSIRKFEIVDAPVAWSTRKLFHDQVSYKCTDFCDDEVLFSGMAHGGRTELPPDKAPSALMSVTLAEELGIFGVKPSKAMDMLTGKRVSLGLSIEAYDREVRSTT